MEKHNTLIVSGTGQNVGKTTLICNIIKTNKAENIIAIKISPHFHKLNANNKIIVNNKYFTIVEETLTNTQKDSSKMLNAGAKRVFYIQCADEFLPDAFNNIIEIIPKKSNVIIESGGARNVFIPNLFVIIMNAKEELIKPKSKKNIQLADLQIIYDGGEVDFDLKRIIIKNNAWYY